MTAPKDILALIIEALPSPGDRKPLVSDCALEWHHALGATRGYGRLILYTNRELTTEGGDGWGGFDGADLTAVHDAAYLVLREEGALGLVRDIVVRQREVRVEDQETSGFLDRASAPDA